MTATPAALDGPPRTWRLRGLPGRVFDLGVVAALLLVGAAIVAGSTQEVPHLSLARVPWYAVVAVALGAILLRRRLPRATLAVVLAVVLAESALGSPIVVEPLLLVAVYTVASRFDWRVSLPLAAAAAAVRVVGVLIARGEPSFAQMIAAFVPVAGAFVAGIYVGTRTAYIDSLQARATQVARERELLAQRAVAEERVRIARELHDVVAHHLSLVTVQAAALQTQLAPDSPAHATAGTMAATGRQALDEMRRMLGVLRLGSATDTPGHAPQPGIDDIGSLVEQASAVGVDVTLDVTGDVRPLPAGIDLSVYRIVQEALTNVMRHAGGARCAVVLEYSNAQLVIRITNGSSAVPASPPATGGQGLIGMRERVALLGGTMTAAPTAEGGFAVSVTLPVPPPGTAR